MTAALIPFTTPEPMALIPPRLPRTTYPVAALGPVLQGAAEAIVEATQCAAETAAQSVLAVAALATQAHADVRTPAGLIRPLSLFLATVAASGERKSAADGYALDPVRTVQDEAREPYRAAFLDWRNSRDAWEAERRRVTADRKSDLAGKRLKLDSLGSEPLPPLRPERTVEDATVEGLVKSWADCQGARGLFSPEGAKVLAGHSMNDENRLRTAATWSALWDDGRAERVRAGDGYLALRGRRLTMHLMVQPEVARLLLNARDLADQGLLGRFLVAEAEEKAGTRMFRLPPAADDPRFAAYGATVADLLTRAPATWDGRNELNPRVLPFTSEAEVLWIGLHDALENRLRPDGELAGCKSFGNKLAEHAARMAAVLTLFAHPNAQEVTATTVEKACDLAEYYAAEAARLAAEGRVSERLADAEALRVWLLENWREPVVSVPDAQQHGPRRLRTLARLTPAFAALAEHGWIVSTGEGEVAGARRREVFRIVRPR